MDATFMEWLGYATLYAVVVKAVLASTPTPPPDRWYGKLYRALEWSVMVVGRVKEGAGR
ncbi:hypothetical protein ABNQ39_20475 [Azospirillum sp. A26]|uniref:hypothetical protein n=1 Tax=Azospirillum sp. A26 TaxID=3160607 RepID=UPI00367071F3